MKQGATLQDLAREVLETAKQNNDYVAPINMLAFELDRDQPQLRFMDAKLRTRFSPTPLFHQQVGQALGIPKPYYDRLHQQAPALLVENVNHWFGESDARNMIRTSGTSARALLSTRYRPLDNHDMLEAMLPVLEKSGMEVVSSSLTDTRLYIKAVTSKVTGEIKKGDAVQAGIVLSNSEVGMGSLSIQPLLYRLVCLNGAIMEDQVMRRQHIGRNITGDDDSAHLYLSDETRRATSAALFLQARDMVGHFLQPAFFQDMIAKAQTATVRPIEASIEKVVAITAQQFRLNDTEETGVLRWLASGNDMTQWGLANAVTRLSQDVDSYARATELERVGGQIISLDKGAWSDLAAV